MRTLNTLEIQNISGGIDISFFYGALSGAQKADYPSTAIICSLIGAAEAALVSMASLAPVGIVVGVPVAAVAGATMGTIGYAVGSLFSGVTPQQTVVIR